MAVVSLTDQLNPQHFLDEEVPLRRTRGAHPGVAGMAVCGTPGELRGWQELELTIRSSPMLEAIDQMDSQSDTTANRHERRKAKALARERKDRTCNCGLAHHHPPDHPAGSSAGYRAS
jgi:hypothetical protein